MKLKEAHQSGIINVTELASKCAVSRPTVYSWINGEQEPKASHIRAVEAYTDGAVTFDDF